MKQHTDQEIVQELFKSARKLDISLKIAMQEKKDIKTITNYMSAFSSVMDAVSIMSDVFNDTRKES